MIDDSEAEKKSQIHELFKIQVADVLKQFSDFAAKTDTNISQLNEEVGQLKLDNSNLTMQVGQLKLDNSNLTMQVGQLKLDIESDKGFRLLHTQALTKALTTKNDSNVKYVKDQQTKYYENLLSISQTRDSTQTTAINDANEKFQTDVKKLSANLGQKQTIPKFDFEKIMNTANELALDEQKTKEVNPVQKKQK
ncbi:Hypothetical_protein [Hexamita inflata]|uniref:Hypothetical_protein n=1 Tax=Hexamita inflata TaxID=28002 RepID=A0ABP1JTZ3_9EUKA